MSKKLYEILVPTIRNDGRPIKTRFHRIWDEKVIEISGGITILSPAKGTWVSPESKVYKERMIPVRIYCDDEDIEKIVDFTMEYYEQEAVLAYVVSSEVILKNREGTVNSVRSPTKEQLMKIRSTIKSGDNNEG